MRSLSHVGRGIALALLACLAPALAGDGGPPPVLAPTVPAGVEIRDQRGKEKLRFLVFGDSGTGRREQYDVGRAMAEECAKRGGCDFALFAGDLIYPRGIDPTKQEGAEGVFDWRFEQRFEAPYEPLGRMDFWAVPGNHDWWHAGGVATEIDYTRVSARLRMPGIHFAVPLLPEWIRIYGIDTTTMTHGKELYQVEAAHAALCGGGGWRLLIGHHPVYTSGKHASSRGEIKDVRRLLLKPLIEPCGVHLYISGHDHHQEHISANGFDQIIQGAAAWPHDIHEVKKRPAGVRQLVASSRLGFAIFEATPERMEIRFFGRDDGTSFGNFYCRVLEFETFDDPERRSHPCE